MSNRQAASFAPPIKLTFDSGKGLYKKCIGKKRGEDGQLRPRIFWLGRVQHVALQRAKIYADLWREMEDMEVGEWTPEYEQEAERQIRNAEHWHQAIAEAAARKVEQTLADANGMRRMVNPAAPAITSNPTVDAPAEPNRTSPPASGPVTSNLFGAIKVYLDSLNTAGKAQNYRTRAAECMDDLKARRADVSLDAIDYLWLKTLVDELKARPKSRKTGRAISPYTAKTLSQHYRQLFTFIDDCSDSDRFGGWEAPRKFAKAFRFRPTDLMTPTELRKASTIEQFDTTTLAKLYKAAGDKPRARAIMLTALFTGATQQELAVMEKSEFDLDKATLCHFRNKTGIEGRFWLPPELVTLLRAEFNDRPHDHLAFRTKEGNPLVTFREGKKASDAVRQMWEDVREAAKVPDALTFKYLRKYLADWMTRHGGEAMGQVALSHSRQTVLAKNYTTARDFAGFMKLQRKMHAELTKAKVFDAPKVTKNGQQKKKKAA